MVDKTIKAGAFARLVRAKLSAHGVPAPANATKEQWYTATVAAAKELLARRAAAFRERARLGGHKRVAYLCMEFLVGRSFIENLEALGVCDELSAELSRYGLSLSDLYASESDPGLGNGGLGRLAACFLDSLSALSYPAIGYSLCYESGLFRQRIVDGEQVELSDDWIASGGAWLVPRPEATVAVRFGGRIEERFEGNHLHITHTEYEAVRAVPYDLYVPGGEGGGTNILRLWRAKEAMPIPDPRGSQTGYVKAMQARTAVGELTRSLYPPDEHDEGKLLRLCQQYFLVSASLQDIVAEHFADGGTLATLPMRVAIHINDTHPALAIPELLRILMDTHSYPWEGAWEMVSTMVSYTNHTVMPEALECWRTDLFRMKLPRLFSIVEEINRRKTAALWARFTGDWDRISRMAVVANGQVRMANISVVTAHTVNGVSRLHSDILKKTVFSDFYEETPQKFKSITNGVTHRRWLLHANRELCALLDELIGTGYRKDPEQLEGLLFYRGDSAVLERLSLVKRTKKESFSRFLVGRGARPLDPEAVFDVQIKRMHEYKRQLLNVLKILSLWEEVRAGKLPPRPIVFLFGGKAARGYHMAKEMIRLIVALGAEIARDPVARDALRVEFCEDYNVTMAEQMIPAADISEQISLAGKEASGTGCMKLMMNGAVTLGTLDGANVEIRDAVGAENIYIFGLNERDVEGLWCSGYDARLYYRASDRLRAAVDRLYSPLAGKDLSHIAEYLIAGRGSIADPYMCLADFDAYRAAFDRLLADYEARDEFSARSLVNIARSGRFSSDRCIREYAEEIWHITRVNE